MTYSLIQLAEGESDGSDGRRAVANGAEEGIFQRRGDRHAEELLRIAVDETGESVGMATGFESHED